MLLLKKYKFAAVALLAATPILLAGERARADEQAPPAPIPAAVKHDIFYSIKPDEISKYISGFKTKKVTTDSGTHLEFIGLGNPNCLRHVRFELDTPNDDQSGVYAIRIERADIKEGEKLIKAEDDCKFETTRSCTRDTCANIKDEQVAAQLGIASVMNMPLTQSTRIQWRTDDRTKPEGHEDAIKFAEIPKLNGGPLDYKTPEDIAKEYEAQHKKEFNELLVSTCKEAQKGNREEFETLKEYLGEKKLEQHKKFIDGLEKIVDNKELENVKKEASEEKSLNAGIEKLCSFGEEHPKMRDQVGEALVELVKSDLDGMEGEDSEKDINKGIQARFMSAQKALKCAMKLNPKNKDYKKRLYAVKLERFRFAASTGSDRFYNEQTQREAFQAYRQVETWAQRSRDPEISGLAKDYRKTFADAMVPIAYSTPAGPQVAGYIPGTTLDETFVKRSLEEEFRSYRSSRLFDSSGSTYSFGGGGNSGLSGVSGGYGNNRF